VPVLVLNTLTVACAITFLPGSVIRPVREAIVDCPCMRDGKSTMNMSAATDLQREATSCAERRLCHACVINYSRLTRAVSSAATGNHINRGRFFIFPRSSSRDLEEDCERGADRRRASVKPPWPYTVRRGDLDKYVAVALSVPNYF
jgi:hypothetical protein